jgi:hypothetical protein
MIIGVSGKIGSGKDLVGLIIQYLSMVDTKAFDKLRKTDGSPLTLEDHFNATKIYANKSTWQIKKFADKLKECASLILGIPREDFEKIEVKNRELGEEWNYAKVTSEKTFGQPKRYATQTDAHKHAVQLRNQIAGSDFTAQSFNITVRDFLQQFGTDACREIVHPNFWVNALFSEYDKVDINEFTSKPISKLEELTPLEPIISKYTKIRYRCFCGKVFKTVPYKIEIGHTKSCGCYQKSRAGETQYKDGRKGSRLWNIYNNMIQRCENSNQPRYSDYGGRGITVSDAFKPFENFKKWAENNGYNPKLTLDRIEVNDSYCPDNCRFTTTSVQAINARKRNDNVSGYRGVSFETKENKWRSQIQIDGNVKFLGYFNTPQEASVEYEKWYKIREDKYIKKSTNLNTTKKWIITDVRFPNELEAIEKRDGINIRVNRNTELEQRKQFAEIMAINKTPVGSETVEMYNRAMHPSETALDNAAFKYTIDNNDTIEELIVKVKEILIKEKILMP